MGEFSIWHWLIVLGVVLLLFGSGKVSSLMGDFAKGIKAFKKNMADDAEPTPASRLEPPRPDAASLGVSAAQKEEVPG